MNELTPDQRHALRKSPGRGFYAFLAFIAVVIFAVIWQQRRYRDLTPPRQVPVAAADPMAPPAAATAPAAPPAATGDSKVLVHDLVGGLSDDPRIQKWANEPDVLHRWVSATQLFLEGDSPRALLGFLRSPQPFTTVVHLDRIVASPKTEHRYDSLVQALQSIDPVRAAEVYLQLRPYAQAAFNEIGQRGQSFDVQLRTALTRLGETAVPTEQPELRLRGAIYEYVDPKWEGMTAGQKTLLRMGEANARALQNWTADFLAALPPGAS
jgi:hypothetical protein